MWWPILGYQCTFWFVLIDLLKCFGRTCKCRKYIKCSFFSIYQKGIYCYTAWFRYIGEKRSRLCTDSFSKEIYSWRELWFSTYQMKYVLVKSPFSEHFVFPRYSKSTSTFCISGNFIEHIAELEDHFHISFITESNSCDWSTYAKFVHACNCYWVVSQHFRKNLC